MTIRVKELRELLSKVPDEALIVMDTSIVLGNYVGNLTLDVVEIANDGSLLILITVPDKDPPEPSSDRAIIWPSAE
jgi:hypothetical protein